jgi:uncharacterized protein with PQ loop repeat
VTAAAVVGTVGVLLNQVFIWPQVLRALRTVEGVAALTVLMGLLARTLWSVYGAVLDDVALVWGNVPVAVGFLALVVLLARRRRADALRLAAAAAGVLALVVAITAAGEGVLGWVAVVAAAVVNLPQMVRALADPERLAGVSVPTYALLSMPPAAGSPTGYSPRSRSSTSPTCC